MTGKLLGALGTGGSLVGATGHLSNDSLFLLVAAVVFALATWRSKAPGILRSDNEALAKRLGHVEEDRTKLRADLDGAKEQIAELQAKDTGALFDLIDRHDRESTRATAALHADLAAVLEALKIIASGALADVPVVRPPA